MSRIPQQLERAILSRYPGVAAADVARLEGVDPDQVRAIRRRQGRGNDGLPLQPHLTVAGDELCFEDYDKLMRSNRSVQA